MSDAGYTVRCVFDGKEIDPRTAYRRVTGWERKSALESRKGGSDIVLREPIEEYACGACITRLQAGIAVGQESLL